MGVLIKFILLMDFENPVIVLIKRISHVTIKSKVQSLSAIFLELFQ